MCTLPNYLRSAHSDARNQGREVLSREDVGFEFMLNALRLTEGFESHLFQDHTGLPISVVEAPLRRAEELELIEWSVTHIRPTEQGRNYLNDLLQMFLP